MRRNVQFPADLVTFNEDILNGELHFYCSIKYCDLEKYGVTLEFTTMLIAMFLITLRQAKLLKPLDFKNSLFQTKTSLDFLPGAEADDTKKFNRKVKFAGARITFSMLPFNCKVL